MSELHEKHQWPLSCLKPNSVDRTAVIILNTPLDPLYDAFVNLWSKAVLRVCVDGGLNELYKVTSARQTSLLYPHIVTGDFDSVEPKILQFYKEKDCEIISTPDQNFTDFPKSLRLVCDRINTQELELNCIVVLARHGGRFDHVMGNIDTLYTARSWTSVPVYLVTSQGLTTLLDKGKHILHVNTGLEGSYCGLLPMNQPCPHVTTTGLKWNLDDDTLQFGKFISVSNTYNTDSRLVTIETESPVLWTMDYTLQ